MRARSFISSFVTALTLLISVLVAPAAHAATTLDGNIWNDTTISAAQSPYYINTSFKIHGVTLTIEPGVEIEFGPDAYYMFEFDGSGNAIVGGVGEHTVLRGRVTTQSARNTVIQNGQGSVAIQNSAIANSEYQFGATEIAGSHLLNFKCLYSYAPNSISGSVLVNSSCSLSSASITGSTFIAGTSSTCAITALSDLTITGNEFRGYNANNAICGTNRVQVNAQGNYWGTTETAAIRGMVFDAEDGTSTASTVDTANPLEVRPVDLPEPWAFQQVPAQPSLSVAPAANTAFWSATPTIPTPSGLPNLGCELQAKDLTNPTWRPVNTSCSQSTIEKSLISTSILSNEISFRFRTYNADGSSPWSDLAVVTVPALAIPAVPVLGVVGMINNESGWSISVTGVNDAVSCAVEARDAVNTSWRPVGTIWNGYANCRGFGVLASGISSSNLSNSFEIRVSATNLAGTSAWSEPLLLNFSNLLPTSEFRSVRQLTDSANLKTKSVTIAWKYMYRACWIKLGTCPIEAYRVRYAPIESDTWIEANPAIVPSVPYGNWFTGQTQIAGLKPATMYKYQVGVKNAAGWAWTPSNTMFTAGTRTNYLKLTEQGGTPIVGAKLRISSGGGYTSKKPVKTNSQGIAVLPASPIGPVTLTIDSASLSNGVQVSGSAHIRLAQGLQSYSLPVAPVSQQFVVAVRSSEGTPIEGSEVHVADGIEGVDVDLSTFRWESLLFKGIASRSVGVTDASGNATFQGLINFSSSNPPVATASIDSASVSGVVSSEVNSTFTELTFDRLPFANAQVLSWDNTLGGMVTVMVTAENVDFAEDLSLADSPVDEKIAVSVLGPDGAGMTCRTGVSQTVAQFDANGVAQLSFCANAVGEYLIAGNGIYVNKKLTLLPTQSAPSAPQNITISFASRGLAIGWSVPKYNVGNPQLSYQVQFRLEGSLAWKSCVVAGLTASCSGLKPGKTYEFAFTARNQYGSSPTIVRSFLYPATR